MADNTPIAEPAAVAAVGGSPVEQNAPQNNAPQNNAPQNERDNRDRDNRDDDRGDRNDRDDRGDRGRGNRDRDRGDRDGARLQGPTDLMPELEPQDQAERKEVENGRAYEVSYIVMAGQDEAVNSTQERLKAMIEGAGGALDNARVSEVRRLAYPINKRAEGVYVVVNARFNQTLIQELDRFFKLEDSVMRHIVLREGR